MWSDHHIRTAFNKSLLIVLVILSVLTCTESKTDTGHSERYVAENVDSEARIWYGDDAVKGEFPFAARFWAKDNGAHYLCGGSIISERIILTAATCTMGEPVGSWVAVGDNSNNLTLAENWYEVVAWHPHEDFNTTGHRNNDIALVILNEDIEFGDYVSAIRLPTESDSSLYSEGQEVTVIGWGGTESTPDTWASTLQKLTYNFLSEKTCKEAWGGDIIQPGMICAGKITADNSPNAWDGDGGSPVFATNDNGDTPLLALVSFRHYYTADKVWDVNTNVLYYVQSGWLATTINAYYTGDWASVITGVAFPHDLEGSPLQIKTDSTVGSDEQIFVILYTADGEFAGYIGLYFYSTPQLYIYPCTNTSTNFTADLPADQDKTWTIIKTVTALRITCNDVEVLNMVYNSSGCTATWSKDVEQIMFYDSDTASDWYREIPAAPNYDCYDTKCKGDGHYATFYLPCDNRDNVCGIRSDGSPVCQPNTNDEGKGIKCNTQDQYICEADDETGLASCQGEEETVLGIPMIYFYIILVTVGVLATIGALCGLKMCYKCCNKGKQKENRNIKTLNDNPKYDNPIYDNPI